MAAAVGTIAAMSGKPKRWSNNKFSITGTTTVATPQEHNRDHRRDHDKDHRRDHNKDHNKNNNRDHNRIHNKDHHTGRQQEPQQ